MCIHFNVRNLQNFRVQKMISKGNFEAIHEVVRSCDCLEIIFFNSKRKTKVRLVLLKLFRNGKEKKAVGKR